MGYRHLLFRDASHSIHGFRTKEDIEKERYALKILGGDLGSIYKISVQAMAIKLSQKKKSIKRLIKINNPDMRTMQIHCTFF